MKSLLIVEEFFHELRLVRKAATSVIVCSVDEKLIEPLRRIGPVHGMFCKGDPGGMLVTMINEHLGL
jgi:hypothetical protein